jgi:hypothetical protein
MPRPRVLVAHLFHEGHCFNPTLTRAADFFVFEGRAMLEAARERLVMTWPDLDAVIDRVLNEPSG